jgi:hypothetical protein
MVVKVLSKLEQMFTRLSVRPSLPGSSMLVRLRAGIVGLLGIVAAVGLGLIAFVAQQGLPGIFNSPLPEGPVPLVRNDAISLPPSPERDGPIAAPDESGRPIRGQGSRAEPAANLASDLTGSRQVAESTPPDVPPSQPGDVGAPAPPPSDPQSPAAPAPPPGRPASPESTSVPVVAGSDDVSPGRSGKSKRKSRGRPSKAPGPPPWAGHDDDASDEDKSPGKDESFDNDYYDDRDYDDRDEDDDSGYKEYDDDRDDDDHDRGWHGRRDWDGD